MSSQSSKIATFRGEVRCHCDARGPLGLTLTGKTDEEPDEALTLSFSGPAPEDLPAVLADAWVERVSPHQYRIYATREWLVTATAVHLHRDAAAAFCRAIPPRMPPLRKRLFWRIVLALVGLPAGKPLLGLFRRR
jgi:hypothetical protein